MTAERTVVTRSAWSGHVSFGLVSVPIKLYTGTESRRVSFKTFCRTHQCAVKAPRVCEEHGEYLGTHDVVKGVQTDHGLVLIDEDEVDGLALPSSKQVSIQQFVPVGQLQQMKPKASYLVGADKGGDRALGLLRAALRKTGTAGVAKVQIRGGGEQLCAVTATADGDVVLTTMYWPDEVRDGKAVRLTSGVPADAELEMAIQLVGLLKGDFDPTLYEDTYRHAVETLVASKSAEPGTEPAPKTAAPKPTPGPDLLAAMKESIAKAKAKQAKDKEDAA